MESIMIKTSKRKSLKQQQYIKDREINDKKYYIDLY